jgi:hypothetical protein
MPSDHHTEMHLEMRDKYSIFENTNENEMQDENDKKKDYELTKWEAFNKKVDETASPFKRSEATINIVEQKVIDEEGNLKVSYTTK